MTGNTKGLMAGAKGLEPSTSAVTGQRPSSEFKGRFDSDRGKSRSNGPGFDSESKHGKASTPRVDSLTAPPVVGQFYLVRTVLIRFFTATKEWPVIGPAHEDGEIGGLSIPHHHLDWRFIPASEAMLERRYGYVLNAQDGGPLPKPILRRRKCVRANLAWYIPWNRLEGPVEKVRRVYAGRQCTKNEGGFVCPHRHAPLGSIKPHDGVIVCPLHGLRINAETGVVLPAEARR